MTRVDMLQCLRDKGVVEMHEPGAPVAELVGAHEHCPLLVLNAIESEPYLRTETTILAERGKEVFEGLSMLKKILSPEFVIAAFGEREEGERAALLAMLQERDPSIESAFLAPRYPQDLPNQLLSVLRIGKRSFSVKDSLMITPSTALAVYEAVVHAKPLVERYVTIAGGAIKYPAVLKARIGTAIGDLIEECGGLLGKPEKILSGGPLRGSPVFSLDAPVTKQTSGILALTKEETNRKRTEACIRCGRCADVCPERLAPSEIFRRLEKNRREDALAMGLEDCSLCGACGYVCPSRIPLVEAFRCGMKARGVQR
jgi:electron transport complex protein RnfC